MALDKRYVMFVLCDGLTTAKTSLDLLANAVYQRSSLRALSSDDFGGQSELDVWPWEVLDNPSHVSITGGLLSITISGEASSFYQDGVQTIETYPSGDFDISVDFSNFSRDAGSGEYRCGFEFFIDDNNKFQAFRYVSGATNQYWGRTFVGGVNQNNQAATTDTSGKLRIERNGTTLNIYYYNAGWQLLHTRTGCPTSGGKVMIWGVTADATGATDMSVDFDNYASDVTIYPTGGVTLANANGTNQQTLQGMFRPSTSICPKFGAGTLKVNLYIDNMVTPYWSGDFADFILLSDIDLTDAEHEVKLEGILYAATSVQDCGSFVAMYMECEPVAGGGACDYPVPADVRGGTLYDRGNQIGTLDLPDEADVRDGVAYDSGNQTGTLDLPATSDVVEGVTFDNGNQVGTYTCAGDVGLAADIRAAIYNVISGIPGIGVVHDYERWAADWGDFINLFKSGSAINGWEISRRAAPTAEYLDNAEELTTHVYVIKGYRAVDDSAATEKAFNTDIELIRAAFRFDFELGGLAELCGPVAAERIDTRAFAGVLCHYCELALPVKALESA